MLPLPPTSTLFPYTTLFRSYDVILTVTAPAAVRESRRPGARRQMQHQLPEDEKAARSDYVYENRSEEHTSELQSQFHLVCRLLLEKKNDIETMGETVKVTLT